MTEVYLFNCNEFSDQEMMLEAMGNLSPFRRKKVNQAKSITAKRQRLGVGLLLDCALRSAGRREKEMEYGVDPSGKPFFSNCPNLFFNLSHSGDWVICALSDGNVGADVQIVSDYNARVAGRCFSEEDAERLKSLVGRARDEEFTRLWVQKESRMKYCGTWKEQSTPPVTEYTQIDGVKIGVCTWDIPEFFHIKDIRGILFR